MYTNTCFSSFLQFLNQHSREHHYAWAYLIADSRSTIDLFADILLHCKWLNTLNSLVFIWSIHPNKIEVESDENIFSIPDFLQKGIPNSVLIFYSAYQRTNKISEADPDYQSVTPERSIVVLLSDILMARRAPCLELLRMSYKATCLRYMLLQTKF